MPLKLTESGLDKSTGTPERLVQVPDVSPAIISAKKSSTDPLASTLQICEESETNTAKGGLLKKNEIVSS